tara:strand:- start:1073 stop:2158 length:1086 start_codon:yes stop_codon:yes gene_type:complete
MSEQNEVQETGPLIGDVIRKAREKKNVSVKIVAQHTKISSTNLEALEANDFSKLPNKAYVKGYVKSCSKLLGLDEKETLSILQSNYDAMERPTRVKEQIRVEKVKEEQENNQLIFKMIGVVAIVIIFVVMISGGDSEKKSVKSEPVVEATPIAEDPQVVTPVVLSDDTPLRVEVTPAAIATATPAPTPEPTPMATPTPKVVEKKKDEKKDEEESKDKIELRPIGGTLYTFDKTATQDQIDEWLPVRFRAEVVDGKQNVFISAIDGDTWLTYQTDGGEIKKFVLKQGQKLFVDGEEVLLFLGNFNVTKIFLNNKLLSITSRSGVKSLVFPQEKAKEHFYPLFIYHDDGTVENSKTYNAKKNQ